MCEKGEGKGKGKDQNIKSPSCLPTPFLYIPPSPTFHSPPLHSPPPSRILLSLTSTLPSLSFSPLPSTLGQKKEKRKNETKRNETKRNETNQHKIPTTLAISPTRPNKEKKNETKETKEKKGRRKQKTKKTAAAGTAESIQQVDRSMLPLISEHQDMGKAR